MRTELEDWRRRAGICGAEETGTDIIFDASLKQEDRKNWWNGACDGSDF
jgi:hypothetical protein